MPTRQNNSANTGESGAAITPSDTVVQPVPFRAIWVGTAGNITLLGYDGVATLYSNVPVGMFPMGGTRVNATGTTAALLVAVY